MGFFAKKKRVPYRESKMAQVPSTEESSVSVGSGRKRVLKRSIFSNKRQQKSPKFRRFEESDVGSLQSYSDREHRSDSSSMDRPLVRNGHAEKKTTAHKKTPVKKTPVKAASKTPTPIKAQKERKAEKFHKLENEMEVEVVRVTEYLPPTGFIRTMEEPQQPPRSDQSFDNRTADFVDDQSIPSVQSGEASPASSNEFRQFVFDNSLKRIETVAIEKSEPGASDFSDFVQAAAQLTKSLNRPRHDGTPTKETNKASLRAEWRNRENHHPSSRTIQSHVSRNKAPDAKAPGSGRKPVSSAKPHVEKRTPPKVQPGSDWSFSSVSSFENSSGYFPAGEAFHFNNVQRLSDSNHNPFGVSASHQEPRDDAAWFTGANPFHKNEPHGTVKETAEEEDALIQSIRRAASSRDADSISHKPDPSPRGAHTSVNSNDDVFERSIRSVEAPPVQGPQKRPPKGLPNNAILGSMLFRQTHSGSTEIDTTSARPLPKVKKDEPPEIVDSDYFRDSELPAEIPPSIMTDDTGESSVSSVTEEANSFYQKAFHLWDRQALNVLNNYHSKVNRSRDHNNTYRVAKKSAYAKLESVEEEHRNMFHA